jgi:hypothetical protein
MTKMKSNMNSTILGVSIELHDEKRAGAKHMSLIHSSLRQH